MDWTILSVITAVVAIGLHYFWKSITDFDTFEKRGIPFLKPTPYFGSIFTLMRSKMTVMEFLTDAVKQYPAAKIIGLYDRKMPIYLITDPECIKQIGVKDFEYFMDHRRVVTGESDPMFGNSLINMVGQKWKDMRATLSPVFTGSKMRQMFDFLPEIGHQMVDYFKNCPEEDRTVEMKDFFGRFALDAIATTNFGVKVNSLKEKENPFYRNVQQLLDVRSLSVNLRFIVLLFFPILVKLFKIRLVPKSKTRFFEELVRDTEKAREENGIVRPDLIHLLMQIKKGQLKAEVSESDDVGFATVQETVLDKISRQEWTYDELLAQAFIFLFAGFDTVSNAGSYTAYELALNQDVQQKLIAEIDVVAAELQGKNLTYEVLQRMKYMDCVISESLRFWPPVDFTDRMCVKDYTMQNDKGEDFVIEKGSNVWFSAITLHFSEKYYDNPEKFDPERFNDENKHKINSGAYLPFGIGPRNCIGSRFALMELKAAFYYLLKDFTIERTEKTQVPLKIKKGFNKISEKGIYVKFVPRNKDWKI